MKHFGKGIGGALLTLAFVLGISAATSATAQAQYRNNDDQYDRRDQDRDYENDRQRTARHRRDRRDDRTEAQDREWRRNRDWNRGNNGGYGNNGRYGNGRYGNNGGYNNVELNQGYQAGLNTGASDAQRGQSFNPQRSHYYKDARTQAFRQGFLQGYDEGYRQYAGYNRNDRNGTYNRGGIGEILGGILRP